MVVEGLLNTFVIVAGSVCSLPRSYYQIFKEIPAEHLDGVTKALRLSQEQMTQLVEAQQLFKHLEQDCFEEQAKLCNKIHQLLDHSGVGAADGGPHGLAGYRVDTAVVAAAVAAATRPTARPVEPRRAAETMAGEQADSKGQGAAVVAGAAAATAAAHGEGGGGVAAAAEARGAVAAAEAAATAEARGAASERGAEVMEADAAAAVDPIEHLCPETHQELQDLVYQLQLVHHKIQFLDQCFMFFALGQLTWLQLVKFFVAMHPYTPAALQWVRRCIAEHAMQELLARTKAAAGKVALQGDAAIAAAAAAAAAKTAAVAEAIKLGEGLEGRLGRQDGGVEGGEGPCVIS